MNATELDPWDAPFHTEQYISIVTGALSILLNATVLVVFICYPLIDNIPRLFIINQSAVDFLCGCFLIVAQYHGFSRGPRLPLWVTDGVVSPKWYCHLLYSTWTLWVLISTSTLNLVCLNVERFMHTVHSGWHGKYLTTKWVYFILLMVWVIGIGELTWFAVDTQYHPDEGTCILYRGPRERYVSIGTFTYIYFFIAPLIVILFVYTSIGIFLRRQTSPHHAYLGLAYAVRGGTVIMRSDLKDGADDAMQIVRAARQRMIRNVIVTLFIASLAYLVCHGPNQTTWYLFMLGAVTVDFQGVWYPVTVFLTNLNSAINPVIYALKLEGFQVGLLQLVRIRRREQLAVPWAELDTMDKPSQ